MLALQDLLIKHGNVVAEFLTANYDEVCVLLGILILFEHIKAAQNAARVASLQKHVRKMIFIMINKHMFMKHTNTMNSVIIILMFF